MIYFQTLSGSGLFPKAFSISSIISLVNLGTNWRTLKFSTTCSTLEAPVITVETLGFLTHYKK